jgi:hypothetical protein
VDTFEISGISPAADLSTAEGFPLQLVFDSAGAEFTMSSHLVPAVPVLGWPGLVAAGGLLLLAGSMSLRRISRRAAA